MQIPRLSLSRFSRWIGPVPDLDAFLAPWLRYNACDTQSSVRSPVGYCFEFDESNNALHCVWEGVITDAMLLEGDAIARRLLVSHLGCRAINDFSAVTLFQVATETVKYLALFAPPSEIEAEVVIVAPDGLMFGLARMFTMFGEKRYPNFHVVHTIEEAYEILGITSPHYQPIAAR